MLSFSLTRWRRRTAATLLLAVLSCSEQPRPSTPREALNAYAAALKEGRLQDAYEMLSEEAKQDLPFDSFRRMVQENPEEMTEVAEELTRPSGPPEITATVATPNGERLVLVFENAEWRVDGSAIDLYSQVDPKTAVASFVRAFDNRRYDILMRFVPEAKRDGLSQRELKAAWEGEQKEEIHKIVRALDSALPTARVERLGDRATMAYGAAGTVELVREHGQWKIEDIIR